MKLQHENNILNIYWEHQNLFSPKTKAPTYLPNSPELAALPPPATQPSLHTIPILESMREYTKEQLIEDMTRLNIPYSHKTKVYAMKKILVEHYNKNTTTYSNSTCAATTTTNKSNNISPTPPGPSNQFNNIYPYKWTHFIYKTQ